MTRVTCRRINEQSISPGFDQRLTAINAIRPHTHRRTATQAAIGVLRRLGESNALLDVRTCDQSRQFSIRINERKFLNPVLIENPPCLFQAGGRRRSDQTIFRSHHIGNGRISTIQITHITPGDHALKMPFAINDGKSGKSVLCHDLAHMVDRVFLAHGVRLENHRVFRALDP